MKIYLVILLILYSASLFSQADSLTVKLNRIKSKYSVQGMSVAVVKSGALVYNKGFGNRDNGRNLPVNDSTVYRFASVSKMITATALMILYDQGYIELERDISYYLGFTLRHPSFPNDTITVRQILAHTSSLRDGSGYDSYLGVVYSNNPPAIKTLLQPGGQYYSSNMFGSQRPNLKYFQYANINYGVLGALIETVSGQRFDRFVKDNIFTPLGMAASFNIADIPNINNVSVLYRQSGGLWVPQTDNYLGIKPPSLSLSGYVPGTCGVTFGPQGNMRVSTYDLSKFMIMHMQNGVYGDVRILSDSTAQLMHRVQWNYTGSNGNNYYGIFNTYAFGNHTSTDLLPGSSVIGHPGEAYGLISDLYYSPSEQFGIIFVTNGGLWGDGTYSGWYNIEEEVFQAVKSSLNGFVTLLEKDRSLYDKPVIFPLPAQKEFTVRLPEKSTQLFLYTITGELKETIVITEKTTELKMNMLHYPAGVYFLKVTAGDKNHFQKFVINK